MNDVLSNVQSTMSGVDQALSNINTTGFDAVVAASSSASAAVSDVTGTVTSASSAFSQQQAQTAALSQALQDAAQAATEANNNIGDLGSEASDTSDSTSGLADDTDDLAESQEKMGKSVKDSTGFLGKLGGAVSGAAGTVAKYGSVLAGVAGLGGVGVILTKGLDRLTAIDNAKAKLSGLGHEAESVDKIMQSAMNGVKGTAYGLGDAAGLAAGAVAAGVEPGEDLERTIKLIGDAAAIAGADLSDMGSIFNSVAVNGEVSGDVISQLSDRGIPILQLLGKQLGKTSEEVSKMVSSGEVDFETFQAAIESGMGGAAVKAGNTFQGAVDNTGAALGRLGATLLDAPFKAAPKIIGKITESIDGVNTRAKALLAVLVDGDFTGKFTEAFGVEEDSPLVDKLFKIREGVLAVQGATKLFASGDFTGEIGKALGVEEDSDLVDKILTVREKVVEWGDQIGRIFGSVKDLVTQAIGPITEIAASLGAASAAIGISAWSVLLDLLEAIVPILTAVLIPTLQTIADLMNDNQAVVTILVGAYTAWKLGAMAVTAYETAMAAVLKAKLALMPAVTAVTKAYNAVLNANPILKVVGLITLIVGALAIFFTKTETGKKIFESFKDVMSNVWDSVSSAFTKAWDVIVDVYDGIMSGISTVISFIRDHWQLIVPILFGPLGLIVTLVITFWDEIKAGFMAGVDAVTSVLSFLWNDIVMPIFTAIGDTISGIWNNVIMPVWDAWTYVVNDILVPAFVLLKDTVVEIFTGIGDLIMGVWNNVIMPVFDIWHTMMFGILIPIIKFLWNEAVYPVFTAIGDFIRMIWDTVISVVFTAFDVSMRAIAATLGWLWNEIILPAWNGIGNAIKFVWESIIMPTLNGIETGIKFLGDAMSFLWNSVVIPVWDGIGNAINVAYNAVIVPIFDSFKAGLGLIGDAASFLWNSVIMPVWDGIGNSIKSIWEGVIEPAWNAMTTGLGYIGTFFNDTVSGIGRVWDTLHNILSKPINFLIGTVYNDGIAKAWNKVAEFIPGLVHAPMLDKIPERATGGALRGPGTGTSDDILMWGSNGEHMVTAQEVRNAGGQNVVYAIRDMLARGIPFEWDNGRVINKVGRENMERYGSRVQDAGFGKVSPEGMFDVLLPARKDGGAIEPWELQLQKGHEFAKSQHGKPYQWAGPTGPGSSFDCSGFMGSIAAVILGDNPWQRYWATGSFGRGQGAGGPQGFVPGTDGGFTIGVTDDPGGPGGGHTAGTLGAVLGYGPVNVESGGNLGDVHYGGGPSPMSFMGQYRLPIGANGFFQGGSGSGPSPEDQRSWLADKVHDVLTGITEPIKAGIGAAIGSPPPEYLGIPPKFLDNGVDLAADAVDGVIGGLGDMLSSTWAGAQSKVGDVLSFLNPFDSGGLASGKGFLPKNVIEPERVLSPAQTRMFELLVNTLDRITGGQGSATPGNSPAKIGNFTTSAEGAINAQGEILSDTKSLLERTETSAQKSEDARHAAVLKALGTVADQLTEKALMPAFAAGLTEGLKSPEADEITQGMSQTMGKISGDIVGAAIRGAIASGTGAGLPAFDSGGLANGLGFMPKATIAPERVLSPQQTRAFESALNRGFAAPDRGQGVGSNAFGAQSLAGQFVADTIVNAIMKVAGIEFKSLDTLQSVSKEIKAFRGTAEAAFDENGRLLSDTSSLLDRTATSAALANSEKDRFFSELIKGTLKFLVTSVLIPAIGAVLAGLITAATTAIGTAIAGPVGALVGAAVGAALGGVATIVTGAIGSLVGSGIDAVFDEGGIANGMGMMPKAVIEPERVLSPRQTQSFDRLVDILDKGTNRTTINAPFTVKGDARGGEMARTKILSLLNS